MIDVRLRTSPHAQTRRRGHSWSVLISFPIIIACVERTKPSHEVPNEDTHTALARSAIFAVSSSFSPPSMSCFSNASKDAPKAGKTLEPPSTIARVTTLGKRVWINAKVTTPLTTPSNSKVATLTTLRGRSKARWDHLPPDHGTLLACTRAGAGEDPVYITQRMVVCASEDIRMEYIVSVCTYNRPQNCSFCSGINDFMRHQGAFKCSLKGL
jgi:hypothetical protein